MARECKAGNWLFRIDPKDEKEFQRATIGSTSFSLYWTAPNGERIINLVPNGNGEIIIETDRHTYVLGKHGGVTRK